MTSRRQFLQIGVTATAWPLVAQTLEATGVDAASPAVAPVVTPLSAVIYDIRFAESVAFAKRAEALGLTAFAIDADMTRLWFDEIYHRWQRGPAAIAGLTAHGPMFCFAELARDVRMRLVFRAEHRLWGPPSGGPGPTGAGLHLERYASHEITGPVPMVDAALAACRRPASLGATMADVVMRCPMGRNEIVSETARTGKSGPRPEISTTTSPEATEDALYTWLIAPAVRA